MPVYDPEKEKSDIARYIEAMVKSMPGSQYILPDPYDPSSYVHPVVALTKRAFSQGLKATMGSEAGREAAQYIGRVPRKLLQEIDKIVPYEKYPRKGMEKLKETSKGIMRSKYNPGTSDVWETIIGLHRGSLAKTPYHEIGHELYFRLGDDARKTIMGAVAKMDDRALAELQDAALAQIRSSSGAGMPQEIFAEAYAKYLTGDKTFKAFPQVIQHLVKQYNKLMR